MVNLRLFLYIYMVCGNIIISNDLLDGVYFHVRDSVLIYKGENVTVAKTYLD